MCVKLSHYIMWKYTFLKYILLWFEVLYKWVFTRTSFSQAYPKYNEAKQIYTFMDVVLIEVFMAGKF